MSFSSPPAFDGAPISTVIIGLGNPGSKYTHTRHNAGRDLLHEFAKKHGVEEWSSRFVSKFCTIELESKSILLVTPDTFMNLSGNSVRSWLKWLNKHRQRDVPAPNLIVAYDDVHLPVGSIRVSQRGSHAGW